MDLKAIVLDLDGTLLNGEKLISSRTKAKLIEAQEKGIKVILASGRPTKSILKYAEELELLKHDGFIISNNGAYVYDLKKEEIIFGQPISFEMKNKIINHLNQFDVVWMVDQGETMMVNDAFFDIDYELPPGYSSIVHFETRIGNFKVKEVEDYLEEIDQPVYKILVGGNPAYLQEHEEAIRAPFKNDVNLVFSAPYYMDYAALGIDKGNALAESLPKLGILPEQTISFGDGYNDRTLIEYAGVGVAMANAVPEILDLADAVTTSNDVDGIAEFLDQYF